jgi:hypothetical protein
MQHINDIALADILQGKVYVDPLVEEIVSSPQDVMDLLERGNSGRKIGATDWVRFISNLLLQC